MFSAPARARVTGSRDPPVLRAVVSPCRAAARPAPRRAVAPPGGGSESAGRTQRRVRTTTTFPGAPFHYVAGSTVPLPSEPHWGRRVLTPRRHISPTDVLCRRTSDPGDPGVSRESPGDRARTPFARHRLTSRHHPPPQNDASPPGTGVRSDEESRVPGTLERPVHSESINLLLISLLTAIPARHNYSSFIK